MTKKILGVFSALLLVGYLAIGLFRPPQTAKASEEQAVIITIRLHSGDMGTFEERKRIIELENRLAEEVEKSKTGEYDGDEFGEGACTIYVYGPSAERLFSVMQPILRKFNSPAGSYLVKRYGKPGAKQEKISLDSLGTQKPK